MVVLSNFVVRPVNGSVIGSGFLLGYEGQACLSGPAGVDHALRDDQQQIASPLDQHVCVVPVVSRLGAHLDKVTPRPVLSIVFSLRRLVSHDGALDCLMPRSSLGLRSHAKKTI
jgi:hypothetical protein